MPTWHTLRLTTLAFIWRLERGDGVALGFTSHDRDLVRDGFTHRATPGMLPSAIHLTDGLAASDMELQGALTSGALTERDLRAGRWDGARLMLSAVDWEDATAPAIALVRGTLGSVALKDGRFGVTLLGMAHVLDAPVAEDTSPSCRASLGDRRCRVDLAGRRRRAMVVAVAGNVATLDAAISTDSIYDFGALRWLGGAAAGMTAQIIASAGATLTLGEMPQGLALPVAVELIEGCDRQLATCRDRFANVANFQGEPHLPGNDLLTRYGA